MSADSADEAQTADTVSRYRALRSAAAPAAKTLLLNCGVYAALRRLSPLFAALAFIASVSLFGHPAFFTVAVMAQVVFIGIGLLGCIPASRRWNMVGLAHDFCLVHAAAAVGFARGLSGRQTVAWRRLAREPGLQA